MILLKRPQSLISALKALALVPLLAVAAAMADKLPADRTFTGSGTVTDPGDPDCELTPPEGLCSITIEGTLGGQGIGNGDFSSTLDILWFAALDNGTLGGQCAPASGTLTFSSADRSTVTVTQSGFVCEVPIGDGIPPRTFDGSFVVVDSTSRLEGVQGTGRITLSVDAKGRSLLFVDGVFE